MHRQEEAKKCYNEATKIEIIDNHIRDLTRKG